MNLSDLCYWVKKISLTKYINFTPFHENVVPFEVGDQEMYILMSLFRQVQNSIFSCSFFKKMLTDDGLRTSHEERQLIAIYHLNDSTDLKLVCWTTSTFPVKSTKSFIIYDTWNKIHLLPFCSLMLEIYEIVEECTNGSSRLP